MSRERYLVKSFGDNLEGTKTGVGKFIKLCLRDGDGVIVVPTLKDVRHTILSSVLGEDLTKKLVRDREIEIDGKKIKLCSSSTLKNHKYSQVYLALWGTKDMIEDIETECLSCTSVVLVTWLPDDSVDWVRNHPVTVVYDDKKG